MSERYIFKDTHTHMHVYIHAHLNKQSQNHGLTFEADQNDSNVLFPAILELLSEETRQKELSVTNPVSSSTEAGNLPNTSCATNEALGE